MEINKRQCIANVVSLLAPTAVAYIQLSLVLNVNVFFSSNTKGNF